MMKSLINKNCEFDIFCIPGLQVNWKNTQINIRNFVNSNEYQNIIFMGGGCNRDFYASKNSQNGGPNKHYNLRGGFNLTEEGRKIVEEAMGEDGRVRDVVVTHKYNHGAIVSEYKHLKYRVGNNKKKDIEINWGKSLKD